MNPAYAWGEYIQRDWQRTQPVAAWTRTTTKRKNSGPALTSSSGEEAQREEYGYHKNGDLGKFREPQLLCRGGHSEIRRRQWKCVCMCVGGEGMISPIHSGL